MSFPKYPAYKDSGVEWLGEVPEHWVVTRLGNLSESLQTGPFGSQLHSDEYVDDETPVINPSNIHCGRLVADLSSTVSFEVASRLDRHRLSSGDIVIGRRGEMGRCAVVTDESEGWICGTGCLRVRLKPNAWSNFLGCYLQTSFVREWLSLQSVGSTMDNLNTSILARVPLPFPSLQEQKRITAFLDHETAKIDALVAEQEKLITLLQEKRQAVISHAVTKGLNPNAPMKDSGVEWLGEVPEHWSVQRIKHIVATMEQGWSPQCEGFPVQAEEEWGVLKVGCVNGGVFRPEENKTLPSELEPIPELGIKAGDLLISRANTRELVGSAAIALQNYPRLLLCDKLYRVRLLPHACEPMFLALYLGSDRVRGQIELAATGASSSMLNIGQSTILEMDFVVPPLEEQHEILRAVADDVSRIDALTVEANSAVALLQERRTALISAAVTGQIDVRNWSAQEAA